MNQRIQAFGLGLVVTLAVAAWGCTSDSSSSSGGGGGAGYGEPPDETPPVVVLTRPVGGETLAGVQAITWTTTDANPGTVEIRLSNNSGTDYNFKVIAAATADDGSYAWDTTGEVDTDTYRIQVIATDTYANSSTADTSASDFEIDNAGSAALVDSGQTLGTEDTLGIEMADLNADGDPDFVAANVGDNGIWLNDNDGTGNFTNSGQSGIDSALHSTCVAIGDVDGVNGPDLVFGNSGGNTVWLNNGSATFTDSGQSLANESTYGLALGDLDGDTDLDLVTASLFLGGKIWINDGAGDFTDDNQDMTSQPMATCVALGDVDGDLDLDIVLGSATSGAIWTNDGAGNFTDSGQNLGAHFYQALVLGDVDGDLDLDIVTGVYGKDVEVPGKAANLVWLNDGSGTFSNSGQTLGDSNTNDVDLDDLDGDGDLDFVTANDTDNKFWVNDGTGTFTDSGQIMGTVLATGIRIGNVDGDTDNDVVVGNKEGLSNRVYLNQ